MAKQNSQQNVDAVISLKALCDEIERAATHFERDMNGIFHDMSEEIQVTKYHVEDTQKEFTVFESGILQEMNHLVSGFLPQKSAR